LARVTAFKLGNFKIQDEKYPHIFFDFFKYNFGVHLKADGKIIYREALLKIVADFDKSN
jgi:hypothetical protein